MEPDSATGLVLLANGVVRFGANIACQSTILLGLGLAAARLLRRRGAALQSAILRAALAAAIGCPLLSLALSALGVRGIALRLSRYDANVGAVAVSPAAPVAAARVETTAPPAVRLVRQPAWESPRGVVLPGTTEPSERVFPSSPFGASAIRSAGSACGQLSTAAGVLWAAGSFLLLLRVAGAYLRLTMVRRAGRPASPAVSALCRLLSSKSHVRPPAVLMSSAAKSPCLVGLLRPAILLPASYSSANRAALEAVFAHELAHLSRGDCAWNLFGRLACALLFFQPLVWMLVRRLEDASDDVADDWVVTWGIDRRAYARRLAEIAESEQAAAGELLAGVGVIVGASSLGRRVQRILDTTRVLSIRLGGRALVGFAAASIGVAAIAGILGASGGARAAPGCPDGPASAALEVAAASERARLMTQLASADPLVRRESVAALGWLGGADVVEPLLRALQDPDASVRERAAWGLGRTGDPRAVGALLDAIDREPALLDEWLADALASFPDPRVGDLFLANVRDPDGLLNLHFTSLLARRRDKRVLEHLAGALANPPEAWSDERRNCYLNWVIKTMGILGDPGAVDLLAGVLESREPLREEAARALGRIGDEAALQALDAVGREAEAPVRQAISDATFDIQLGAMRALGAHGARRALELATAALASPSEGRRRAALRALGAIGSDEAGASIVAMFEDPAPSVRREAADVFVAEIREREAPETLASALTSSVERVRKHAAHRLALRRDARAFPVLLETVETAGSEERDFAFHLLRFGDSSVVPFLCGLLASASPKERTAAAWALGDIGDPAALEPLLVALSKEADGSARSRMVQALGRFADPRAIAALEEALASPDCILSACAASSLARLGWEPPNETARLRYLVASGRSDEPDSPLPRARLNADGSSLEGPFKLDTPILPPTRDGVTLDPGVVIVHRLEFRAKDGALTALVLLGHTGALEGTWRIRIELLDEAGSLVGQAEEGYRTYAASPGSTLPVVEVKEFGFGVNAGPARAAKFAVRVTEDRPEEGAGLGFIRGIVVSAATGAPVRDAYVGTGDFGDSGGSNYARHRERGYYGSTRTDGMGRFTLRGLAFTGGDAELDAHPLVVKHPEYVRHDAKVALPRGGAISDVTIRLTPAATIEATVVDGEGTALPGFTVLRLESLDGRVFVAPDGDPHLSSFASNSWTAFLRGTAGFSFGELSEGQYAVQAIRFVPRSDWKPAPGTMGYRGPVFDPSGTRYHGKVKVAVAAGEKKAVAVRPEEHGTTLTIELPQVSAETLGGQEGLRPSDWLLQPFVVLSRNPGLLVWDDGLLRGPEDPVLGRLQKHALIWGLAPSAKTFMIRNLPPGRYAVFAGPLFKLAGALVDVAGGSDVAVGIPWKEPVGPCRVRRGALDLGIRLHVSGVKAEDLCDLLSARTARRLRFKADPAIASVTLNVEAAGALWDLLESLYLEKGWTVGEEGADTLVLRPRGR